MNFAKTDKRIGMVTLEGSRTNTNIPPDDFQDFDITFSITDMDSLQVMTMARYICERLILQKPKIGIISSCSDFIFNAVY